MAITYTDNFKLPIPPFGTTPWQQYYRDLAYIMDGVIARYVAIQNFKGAWQNSVAYVVGDKLLDTADGAIYIALTNHTSPALPTTFTAYRTANPGIWTPYAPAGVARGTWAASTTYAANDFVVSGVKYAICLVSHTSGSSFATDLAAGRWAVLVDMTGFVPITIPVTINEGGTNASTASAARANLGLAIGTNVQAYHSTLAALATTTTATDQVPYYTGVGTAGTTAFTGHGRALVGGANATATWGTLGVSTFVQTMLDDADAGTVRATIGAAPSTINTPTFLTLGTTGELANERVFTPGTALAAVDGGAGAAYTLNVDQATASGILRGYIAGLTLSNAGGDPTNDITIAVGVATDDGNAYLMSLGSTLTKQLDVAWAVGNNAGGLDTGAIANNTYHVFLIRRPDTGVVDALFSLSATSPTMPTNYTQKRRIGSIIRVSAAIVLFVQDGDLFQRNAGVNDVAATNPGTAAVTRTLSVPTGINVIARIRVGNTNNQTEVATTYGLFTDLAVSDEVPSATHTHFGTGDDSGTATQNGGARLEVRTNTSAQIRSRISASGANTNLYISTEGWIDTRGRFA